MIIVMKRYEAKDKVEQIIEKLKKAGMQPVPLFGVERTVIAVIGDERILDIQQLASMDGVEKVMPVLKPYKFVSRESHPENSIIDVAGVRIGGKKAIVMAGPCSVEDEQQIVETANSVKEAGASILRGGAFKPRTGPYDFQGLKEEGLKLLAKARDATGLPVVTEVMQPKYITMVAKYADMLQVGARNMQNYDLLRDLGRCKKPVLLKRGMSSTYKELLLAAEYIVANGNPNVVLCERGIRTFVAETRNTLDLNMVPLVKELSHLPIIVDPSHGTGIRSLVGSMAKAGIAAGADGLMVEVHPRPDKAKSDADQTISLAHFKTLMQELRAVTQAVGREL
ncbi:3-deoxy-7-phosphoheptulonate synthase [Candidatus Woesearchaeota archaeon]|nr:3-deoxy-7-phosphoheptulonate synthase [Candidatus Woesearchaeota archaeon]